MVGLVTAKGLALAAGKPLIAVNHLEGHALSPLLADPDLAFPLSAAARLGRPLPAAVRRGRRPLPPPRHHDRRCRRRGVRQDRQAARPRLSRRPGGRARRRRRAIREAVPLPRPLRRLGRAAFLLRRPQERGAARASESGPLRAMPTSPPRSSRRWSTAWSTAPRARSTRRRGATALVVAGGVAANQAVRAALTGAGRRARPALRRAAAVAVHRQCGDDRLGRRAALRGRADRRPRRAGAGALAARSRGREGARRGGEGMRIGVDRRRRLGHRAGPGRGGGRRGGAALGARARSRRGDQRAPREQRSFCQGMPLGPAIRATGDLAELARLRRLPRRHARPSICARCSAACRAAGRPLILCAKGIEDATGLLMHEVAARGAARLADRGAFRPDLRPRSRGRPAHRGDPGGRGPRRSASGWRARIARPFFRPYLSDDVAGAEVGGAVKNVLAIACGVVEGRGLGLNARAALISRGFAEMTRFGLAKGARAETLAGLAGLGDLVLTCSSTSSRNFSLGKGIGEGAPRRRPARRPPHRGRRRLHRAGAAARRRGARRRHADRRRGLRPAGRTRRRSTRWWSGCCRGR